MKLYIFGHAKERKQLEWNLQDKSEEVFEHLIKLFLYQDADAQNHWCEEIAAYLHKVQKNKSNHKYPTPDFIMKNTWYTYEDTFDDTLRAIRVDYSAEVESGLSDREIYNLCEEYFTWLAENLSKKGNVASKEVIAQLNKMLGK